MEIDPRLQDASYDQNSTRSAPYVLNPLRQPPPPPPTPQTLQRPALSSTTQDTAAPYYTSSGSQINQIPLSPKPVPRQEKADNLQPQSGSDRKDDTKRSRACEACRGLKVKCIPDPTIPTCKRCAKARRQCIVTAPSRKRQKKADSRVAELEKKIDDLTATLKATKRGELSGSDGNTSEDDSSHEAFASPGLVSKSQNLAHGHPSTWPQQPDSSAATTPATQGLDRKRKRSSYHKGQRVNGSTSHHESRSPQSRPPTSPRTGGISPKNAAIKNSVALTHLQDSQHPVHEYTDVIDRGILDSETASKIFLHYTQYMAPHMPAVVFPSTCTAAEVRQTKPVLFLAILSVAAGYDHPELQKTLLKEVTRKYADCLICKNDKSIELVQALQISTTWFSPEEYKDAKPYTLIIMASIMAITLGLGQLRRPIGGFALGWKEMRDMSRAPFNDTNAAECRRAWVSCYILCGVTAMTLKQPNLLKWNDHLQECIQFLESSPDALPSDKSLARWATLQRIKDDIALKFEVEDAQLPVGPPSMELEQTLQSLRKRLEQWESQTPLHGSSPLLPLAFHFSQMHVQKIEVRLHYGTDSVEETSPPNQLKSTYMPPPALVERVRNCLATVHRVLDECLSFTVKDVRTIPTFHFIRIAYSVVALLRLNRGAKKPGSELGKIISPEDTEVDVYTNRLLDLMQKAAAEEKCRPAHTFYFALRTIKSWFEHHTDKVVDAPSSNKRKDSEVKVSTRAQPMDPETKTSSDAYTRVAHSINPPLVRDPHIVNAQIPTDHRQQKYHQQEQQQHPQDFQTQPGLPSVNNTPLHLLSQVATDGPPTPSPSLIPTANAGSWYNPSYPPYATPMLSPYDMNNTSYYPPMVYPGTPFANNVAPMYQGTNEGSGFQQALGLQSGQEVDLCAMFMDGNFLGHNGFAMGDIAWGGQM